MSQQHDESDGSYSPSVDSALAAELESTSASSPVFAAPSESPRHHVQGHLKVPTPRVAQSADGSMRFDESYNAVVPFGRDRPSSASGLLSNSSGPMSARQQHRQPRDRPSPTSALPAGAQKKPRALLDDLTDAPEVVYRDNPTDRTSFYTSRPRRAYSEGGAGNVNGCTTTTTTITTTSTMGVVTAKHTRTRRRSEGRMEAWESGAVYRRHSSGSRRSLRAQKAAVATAATRGASSESGGGLVGVGDDTTSVSGSDSHSHSSDEDDASSTGGDAASPVFASRSSGIVSRAVAAARSDKACGWAPVWRCLFARITVALRATHALRRAEQNLRFRARCDGIELAELMSRGAVATRVALELRHLMALYACRTQEAFEFGAILDGFAKALPAIGAADRGAMAMHVTCRRVIRKTGGTSSDDSGHVVVDESSSFGRISSRADDDAASSALPVDLRGVVFPVMDASVPIALELFPAGPTPAAMSATTQRADLVRMLLQPQALPRKGRGEITIAFDWDFTADEDAAEPSPSASMVVRDAKRHTALLHRRMLATEHERHAKALSTEEAAARAGLVAAFQRQAAGFALLRLEETSRTPTLTPKTGSTAFTKAAAISPAQRMRNEASPGTTKTVRTTRAAALLREKNARAATSPSRSPVAATKPAKRSAVPKTPPAVLAGPGSRPRPSPNSHMPAAGSDVLDVGDSSASQEKATGAAPIPAWIPTITNCAEQDPAAHSRTARPVPFDDSHDAHPAGLESPATSLPVLATTPAHASLPEPQHVLPSTADAADAAEGPTVLWRSRPGSRLRLQATVSRASRQSSAVASRAGSPTHSEASAVSGYRGLERRPSRISFRCSPATQPLAVPSAAHVADEASPDPRPMRVQTPEDDRVAGQARRRMSIRHLRERGNSLANSPQDAPLVPVFPSGMRPTYSRSSLGGHSSTFGSPTKPSEPASGAEFRLCADGDGDEGEDAPVDAERSRILEEYVFGANVDSDASDDDGANADRTLRRKSSKSTTTNGSSAGHGTPAAEGTTLKRRVSLPKLRQPEPSRVTASSVADATVGPTADEKKKQRLRTTLSMRRQRQERAEHQLVEQEGLQSDLFDPRAALAEAQRLRSLASRRDGVTRYGIAAVPPPPHGAASGGGGYRSRLHRTISASRSPSPALSLDNTAAHHHHQHGGDGAAKRVRHCTACANRKRVAEERVIVPGRSSTRTPPSRSISPSPVTPPLSRQSSAPRLPAIASASRTPQDPQASQPRTRQPVRTRRSSSVVAMRAALEGAEL